MNAQGALEDPGIGCESLDKALFKKASRLGYRNVLVNKIVNIINN